MNNLFYETLLSDLARALQLPALQSDVQGRCELVVDDIHPLMLVCDGEHQRIMLVSSLEVPSDFPMQGLLAGSLTPLLDDGPGLGLDASSGLYMVWQNLSQDRVTASLLLQEIGKLVDWIRKWQAIFLDFGNGLDSGDLK